MSIKQTEAPVTPALAPDVEGPFARVDRTELESALISLDEARRHLDDVIGRRRGWQRSAVTLLQELRFVERMLLDADDAAGDLGKAFDRARRRAQAKAARGEVRP
jgi:hypothetical protein